jgi:hypothetical protein
MCLSVVTTEQGTIVVKTCPFRQINMATLARFRVGRVLLHLLVLLGDGSVLFHCQDILRELPWIASGLAMLTRASSRLLAALTVYLAQPVRRSATDPGVDPRSLAVVLKRGDVLLTQGNTRFAAVINCLTRSPWSHVSMYVGPLDDRPDPACVVEADIAAGVRSIRLSELNTLHVRVFGRSVSRPEIAADSPTGSSAESEESMTWRTPGIC